MNKKRLLTGVKPTGYLHLGNYFGALLPLNKICDSYDEIFVFIADYHACHPDNALIKHYTEHIAACYMSLPRAKRFTIYRQSDIQDIVSVAWLLQTVYTVKEMQRCHSYKQYIKDEDNFSKFTMKDFAYPILMAADILSIDADTVTVGQDQTQHLEIASRIGKKFNKKYQNNIFPVIPRGYIFPNNIMGVDGRKMSKQYNNTIPVNSSDKQIESIMKSFITDSSSIDSIKNYDTCSLFPLVKAAVKSNAEMESIKRMYNLGNSWLDIKKESTLLCCKNTAEFRSRYYKIINNKTEIEYKLHSGQKVVNRLVNQKLEQMKTALGIH